MRKKEESEIMTYDEEGFFLSLVGLSCLSECLAALVSYSYIR